jgi:hypothetical protein
MFDEPTEDVAIENAELPMGVYRETCHGSTLE